MSAAPRLAVVTARFPHGPSESFLHEEIEALRAHAEVRVVSALPGMLSGRTLHSAALEVARAPLRAARTFAAVVAGPQALHAKIKNAAIFPKALAVARAARMDRIEHIHACWLSAPATVAYVVSKMNGIPWSATGHRYDLVDFNATTVGRPHPGFLPDARFLRTISLRGRRALLRARGVDPDRIHTIHLGVRLPDYVEPAPGPRLRLLYAAALVPVKDHATLFRALQAALTRGISVACTLAGDGPERSSLVRLAAQLGIAGIVRFMGHVPHDDLLADLRRGAYDAVVLTSLDRGLQLCEGIPVSLMEAMAVSAPCIATDSGSVGELVVSGENGILCPPGDANAIAEAIQTFAADVELRRRLGKAARATIAREYDAAENARRLAALLFPDSRNANVFSSESLVRTCASSTS
jgi:colanic acid/amylovoran biosynthesis glycosyltransferase